MSITVQFCLPASYLCSDKTQNEISVHLLRPKAFSNGVDQPERLFSQPPVTVPPTEEPVIEDGTTTVIGLEGIVEVVDMVDDKPVREGVFVPGGTMFRSGERAPIRLSREELNEVPSEFAGTPLDRVEAQAKVSHDLLQKYGEGFQPFTRNKVLEINTDLLPTLEGDGIKAAKGILEIIAYKMWGYKSDGRFFRVTGEKIYLDFVSRKGTPEAEAKKAAIVELFKALELSEKHDLGKTLFTDAVREADRLTITHAGDTEIFYNPALILGAETLVGKEIRVYPWEILMDLSIGILSIDRAIPLGEQQTAFESIMSIFDDLLKKEISESDLRQLVERLLSETLAESIAAAFELTLPPIEKIDLDQIDLLNDIMRSVAIAA